MSYDHRSVTVSNFKKELTLFSNSLMTKLPLNFDHVYYVELLTENNGSEINPISLYHEILKCSRNKERLYISNITNSSLTKELIMAGFKIKFLTTTICQIIW